VQALHGAIAAANQAMPSGSVANPAAALGESGMLSVQTGEFLQNAKDVGDIVVGVSQGRPIYLREVARVEAGAQLPQHYVWFTPGAADTAHVDQQGQSHPAVTITATKKPGENAVDVAAGVRERLDALRNTVIPEDVEVSITRDHGQTAADKANKLIQKLIFATGSVIILVGLALGRREAIIVAAAVILTLTATLFASWAWGFTLNRVSLFALIFSIGILVDDAIVVVENIHRHRSLTPDEPLSVLIPRALDEVGGPTILATFTVIAALLPMAFVSGLMGPYMSPIPINASMGMAISLVIAFTVTPWLALKLTKPNGHAAHGPSKITKSLQGFFARVLTSLLASAKKRWLLLAGILIALLLSVGLAVVQWVVLKKLPFDNKSEYQVVLDMPAGTPLEDTAAALQDMTAFLAQQPELSNVQGYAGTASPITFNGLVRQYCLRAEAESGDLQVNLVDAHQRSEKSHAIAQRHRPELEKIAAVHGARQGGGSAARPARALAHRGRGLWAR
jgi:multidrug efflux pump subunit AcrB